MWECAASNFAVKKQQSRRVGVFPQMSNGISRSSKAIFTKEIDPMYVTSQVTTKIMSVKTMGY